MNKFYITTTLPYVNADPHIGFAAEIVRADVIARYQRQRGREVFFNTGTDEHGLKIYRAAQEKKQEPQAYCDYYASKFEELKSALNLSYNNFIRTTDNHHVKAAQEFWKRCARNGDIYKKNYKIKYCVGCELEKTDSELENGKCSVHPNLEIEIIEEENYFFRWSKYQDNLLNFYKNTPKFIIPNHRLKEITNFVEGGLQDFSISRLREKLPWGVPVPDDEEHVMYVWFDALINYISTLGWPNNEKKFNDYWPGIQVAGKDNLRQQSAMWQAMLMSAGLPNSKQILIFGFITSDGKKMSKSMGNAINPLDLVKDYGTDATRYYLLAELTPFEDSDFTEDKFKTKYTADLANGLGNLVARVSNLIEKNAIELNLLSEVSIELQTNLEKFMKIYNFDGALKYVWQNLKNLDERLSETAPWKIKDKTQVKKVLEPIAQEILSAGIALKPFLPDTAERIIKQFMKKQIKKETNLFPRLS